MSALGRRLAGGLIVSCQPGPGAPDDASEMMAFMARAAEMAGAAAIRANGPGDIAAIKRVVGIPIIGLLKRRTAASPVYITPSLRDATAVAEAGADMIAVDGTLRLRPDGSAVDVFVRRIVEELGVPVVADIDSSAAAEVACAAGATFVATTLAGYTDGTPAGVHPDIDLVRVIVRAVRCPVIAEGRYRDPREVSEAFAAGAHAVVVGGAITDPFALTRLFVEAIAGSGETRPDG